MLDVCQLLQFLGNIGLFPGTVLQDAEVADGSGGSVNWTAQLQLADDAARSQVTGLPQQGGHFLVSNLAGAIAVDTDGNRLSNADGVSYYGAGRNAGSQLHIGSN